MNIRIIGLGNVLMSDDGFGPYVTRVLDAFYEFPPEVQVVDAGTPGLDLTPFLLDADVVIFVDTIAGPGRPGAVQEHRLADILREPPPPRLSPHDPGIREALLTVAAAAKGPADVLMVGVVPEWVATGVVLSRAVRTAIAPVVAIIGAELQRLGIEPRLRARQLRPDTWWERPAAPDMAFALQ